MGLKLIEQNFMDEIDWEYKKELKINLKDKKDKLHNKEINRIIKELNDLGKAGVNIENKPSQLSFSTNINVFKLKEFQENEPQPIYGQITIFDNKDVNQYIPLNEAKFYVYKSNLYIYEPYGIHTLEEQKLLIKEHYFRHEKKFVKLQKEIKLSEKLESTEIHKSREPIPEEVRFAVWRRDDGKCVKCRNNQNLEFDHIIPVAKGGSNTERNIQLLCEKCNREKSDKI